MTLSRPLLAALATAVAGLMIASPVVAQDAASKKEDIHKMLLEIYRVQNKRAEMANEFKELVALRPNDGQVQYDYARYLMQSGDIGGAIPHLRKAAQATPSNADAWGNLGRALMHAKDFEGATTALTKAIQAGGATYTGDLNTARQYQQQLKQYKDYQKQLQKKDQ